MYEQLQPQSTRVSVFAGPVHDKTDWTYRGWRVPRRFWMVAVFSPPSAGAKAPVHAFMVEQYSDRPVTSDEPEWMSRTDDAKEVRLDDVEKATGLKFSSPGR